MPSKLRYNVESAVADAVIAARDAFFSFQDRRFAPLSLKKQTRRRAAYDVVGVYVEILDEIPGIPRETFEYSPGRVANLHVFRARVHESIDRRYFYFGFPDPVGGRGGWMPFEEVREFKRWVPQSRPEMSKLADEIFCGVLSFAEIEEIRYGKCSFEEEPDSTDRLPAAADVLTIYKAGISVAGDEVVPPFPNEHGSARKIRADRVEWFAAARDRLGITPMLEAYAAGVPMEDLLA